MNVVVGWLVFAAAAIVYLMTMEPTVSFWDCPEFITTAYKFEIGHPPGYPFFSLMGHFFTLFASGPEHVAAWVNRFSVVNSAGTVLFLFWTITLLARTLLVKKDEEMTLLRTVTIIGAGVIGAMAFAFTDSFWWSAVETDVFNFSALCTSFSIWAMLRWADVADQQNSDRWIVLLAYVIGISIGVHLLTLLVIPAMAMIYYYRNHEHSTKKALIAFAVAIGILMCILFGIMQSFFWLSSFMELFFVNTLSMPFNSGVLVYAIIAFGMLGWAIYETRYGKSEMRARALFIIALTLSGIPFINQSIWWALLILAALIYLLFIKKISISRRALNLVILCVTMVLIGYSQYGLVLIRSSAQPPMDENSPNNVFSLMSYLNRDQYGDAHTLIYGPYYTADYKWVPTGDSQCAPEQKVGAPVWSQVPKKNSGDKDQYVITGYKRTPQYDDAFCTLFPRMHSMQKEHVNVYKEWSGEPTQVVNYFQCGQPATGKKPSFGQNLHFFFTYQVGFMYLRYFMWNLSGRQSDLQSHGEIDRGNWITGFNFIDNLMVGDQTNLPPIISENKGHNKYYMLPLILGFIGFFFLLFHIEARGKEIFWIICTLFLLTGFAIIVYLNQTPTQPRERDYSYCGSIYAFCIWIGFGVVALTEWLHKKLPRAISVGAAIVLGLSVPAILASQNWDDHDRSNRYTAHDFGANYLHSLAPNAIIFTYGDNDTFPLWYSIEVEGMRPDVRVVNWSYLQTDWYVNQMRREAYTSAPLPISWDPNDYLGTKHAVAYVYNSKDTTKYDARTVLNFIRSDNPQTKDLMGNDLIPGPYMQIKVDKDQVLKTGTVKPSQADRIVPAINLTVQRTMTLADMMIIDMLITNNWERPIYFANTTPPSIQQGLQNYFQNEGIASRVVPIYQAGGGTVNTDVMYDNMMHKFKWGNVQDPKVYLDENILRMCSNFRQSFASLAVALINENKRDSALKVLDYCMKVIPDKTVPHDYYSVPFGAAYYAIHQPAKGDDVMKSIADRCVANLKWYAALTPSKMRTVSQSIGINMETLRKTLSFLHYYKRDDLYNKYAQQWEFFARAMPQVFKDQQADQQVFEDQ